MQKFKNKIAPRPCSLQDWQGCLVHRKLFQKHKSPSSPIIYLGLIELPLKKTSNIFADFKQLAKVYDKIVF